MKANGKICMDDELVAALRAETERRIKAEEEFGSFILTVAHDLAAPLRTLSLYSELLAQKDSNRSVEDMEQFRRLVHSANGRLQGLITGMADYVNASSNITYPLPVDMNKVFRDAADASREVARWPGLNSGKLLIMTSDELPGVRGDPERLVKVARHLLDNAVKFCASQECRVHISSRSDDSDFAFTVQDNGPGVQEKYSQQIFEPFKRLHGHDYPGSGLGLACCRKAIEAHGGRIWVESTAGEGSTFCFTLPKPAD